MFTHCQTFTINGRKRFAQLFGFKAFLASFLPLLLGIVAGVAVLFRISPSDTPSMLFGTLVGAYLTYLIVKLIVDWMISYILYRTGKMMG